MIRSIDRFLRRLMPGLNDHLSDDRLASLFCNELPFTDAMIAKRHLAGCWECRLRQADLEGRRADRVVDLFRDLPGREVLPLTDEARIQFARRLDLQLQQTAPRRWWEIRLLKRSRHNFRPMLQAYVLVFVFGFAAVTFFYVWLQRRNPDITSNALLVGAERWETPVLAATSGVVYQSIRITTPQHTMERSIYRDLQGRRAPRTVKLANEDRTLRVALGRAGVDWDKPISAFDYQVWHDHQRVRHDKIVRAGAHLLKLTTTVADGSVSAQSLTVRDTDFHPVRRTVDLRDIGTVEIAELDFKILPWSAVDPDIFEPLDDRMASPVSGPARILRFPQIREIVTQDRLDESELDARLILNQLRADVGEQIEIHRSPQQVEVEGVVETDERKRQLQLQLRTVPHLVVSIQSVADLKNISDPREQITSIETASMPDQPSPLEAYLRKHGRSQNDINALARRLFHVALTISQESKAMVDLQTRFAAGEQRSILASATLSELIYSHRERLEAALKSERALVAEAEIIPAPETGTSRTTTSSLVDAADKNFVLSKELTQTSSQTPRNADQILAEMALSVNDLVLAAHDFYGRSQSASALSGRK